MNLRAATDSDLTAMVALFFASVHQIAAESYTPEQLNAWAPESPNMKEWGSRLALLETLVAEFEGTLAGFISYSRIGHIEFLYVSPAFSRKGVASALFEMAVGSLRSNGVENLSTDASIEALAFFQSKGFNTVKKQTVERNGVQLRRYAMTRVSTDACA